MVTQPSMPLCRQDSASHRSECSVCCRS